MLATKAFGMGIDIDDIEVVAHFAPTGNVCDCVQEIGRAARRPTLKGEAYYKFMKNDFKHINKLHGISVVKDYQLIQVIKKVYDLHQENINNNSGKCITKKRNEMLVDAENFSHIFENLFFSEDDGINKVKTAMLLIQKDSFPKFKYLLYTNDEQLNFKYKMTPALCIEINFENNYLQKYIDCINSLKSIVNNSVRNEKFYRVDGEGGLVQELMNKLKINKYRAKSIVENILSAIAVYQRDYTKNMYGKVITAKLLKSGETTYKFTNATTSFFRWIEKGFNNICDNISEDILYLIDEGNRNSFKEKLMILGLLETLEILVFSALGGKNSQIYIYVNQTKTMKEIIDKPFRYKNRLLDLVGERHEISVEMLSYLFEGNFTNDDTWNKIEDYFLGIITEKVIKNYEKKTGKKLEIE